MRVLFVVHQYLPRHRTGVEIYADRLARALRARGHEPAVLATEDSPSEKNYSARRREVGGVPVIEVVNNRLYRSLADTVFDPEMERRFEEALDETRPDVVHFQHLLFHSLGDPGIARARGLPTVMTLHEFWLQCLRGGLRRTAGGEICRDVPEERCARCLLTDKIFPSRNERWAIRATRAVRAATGLDLRPLLRRLRVRMPRRFGGKKGKGAGALAPENVERAKAAVRARNAAVARALEKIDLLLAPSRFLRDEFVANSGVDPSRIRLWTFGLDAAELGPPPAEAAARAKDSPLRLAYIGNPAPHKGLDVAVRAMRLLPKGTAALEVYGNPERHPAYLAEALKGAPEGSVAFRGEYGDGEAAAVFARTDALVFPSLWFENSPLTIHEAMLRRVPVVASRLGAMPEFVRDGENGLLFDAGDPAALAAAIARLASEKDLLDRLRAGARAAVRSPADEVEELLGLYSDLVRGRGGAKGRPA